MLRVILFFLAVVAMAVGLSWLADRPGRMVIDWQGHEIETSVFHAVVLLTLLIGLVILTWSILRSIWQSPAALGNFFNRRREQRGLEALSSGMIAIGAGDKAMATRYAVQARKALPNEPLTHLLRAQAAQLAGDRTTSRRIFEAMLATPDTEQLGLRGLFLEAEREGETEAARQFAGRAVKLNPKLTWPVQSLFEIQCREGDWSGALETLQVARKNGHVERSTADRRRAVLLTAIAQQIEATNPEQALQRALEAHHLANDLVPAAAIAGRMLASRGNTPKAAKVVHKTWRKNPHPDLAIAYAYARLGDSPRDRLDRIKQLAAMSPFSIESPIAVAQAAIEAKAFTDARAALEPLTDGRLTQRVCTLMARVEGEEHGDQGRVREWLARAVNAPRDPAWTADGVVADRWAPVSPVTGALDAFQWRVPVEDAAKTDSAMIAEKIEELVKLGVRPEQLIAADGATDVTTPAAPTAPSGMAMQAAPVRKASEAEIVDVAPVTAAATRQNDRPSDRTNDALKPAAKATATAVPTTASNPEQATEQASARAVPSGSGGEARAATVTMLKTSTGAQAATTGQAARATGMAAEAANLAEADRKVAGKSQSGEPRMFVPPRAPDDPGPEPLAEATTRRPAVKA